MQKLRGVIVCAALCYATNASASLNGTYTINPGGTASSSVYLSLTDAISDLVSGTRSDGGTANGSGVSGPVILELASGYTVGGETFPLTLGIVSGSSGTNTITIRPASGVGSALSIASSNTTATININGGNYFIFDGRPGGSGSNKYITIDNTSTSAPAVQYINDASNNIIKYCTLSGVNTTTFTGAVVLFSTTTGSSGNDNNTIDYCDIRDGATQPLNAIYSAGTSAKENSGNTISNCNIYNFFNAGAASNGIYLSSNNESWTITDNSFYQTSSLTATSGSNHRVLYIQAGSGHTITNNYIGGSAAQCGSSAWTISGSFASRMVCIDLSVGTSTATSVQGNTIANFSWTTTATTTTTTGVFCGINISAGAANIGTTSANTIGSGTSTGSISVTPGNGGLTVGIVSTSSGTVSISNNIIGSITTNGSSATIGASLTGIFIPSVASSGITYTVHNNTIGSTSTANSMNASNAITSGTQLVYGINVSGGGSGAGPTINISNNTIANVNNNTTAASQTVGIRESGIHSISITGNTIRNLTTSGSGTGTATSASLIGISSSASGSGITTISNNVLHSITNYYTGSNGTFVLGIVTSLSTSGGTNLIDRNFIHSLKNSKTSGGAVIAIQPLGNLTLSNNMVRLGLDASGNSITATDFRCIDVFSSYVQNYYHNSFYIGGTGVANGSSAVLYINFSGTLDIRNNIFVNARSNGSGSGRHYINLFYSLPTLTMDYNQYYLTGTGGTQGYIGPSNYNTLSDWKTASSKDANSFSEDPVFVNATGNSSVVDLHLSDNTPAESAGTSIGSVTTDFDGDTRSSLTPIDIGADAGNFGNNWNGSTSTNWNTAANWSFNSVPTSSDYVIINDVTNDPVIAGSSTFTVKAVIVSTGASIAVGSSGVLQVTNALVNNGTISGLGKLSLTGSSAQTISGTGTYSNMELNNSTGATNSGTINITDTYTPTSGTLTTGDNLTLKSTASATARIASGSGAGGYISGNVTQERYIPGGRRAFRFLSHPFTSALSMSALTDDIDITGSGGSPFTTTSTNNPSAYYFDVTTGDNTTSGNNPGWTAYTASSSWAQYQAMRVLVRGAKGEGLVSGSYTPSAVTIDMSGTVNQGDVTVNLTKGSGTNFVLVGNPFPSQVNMDAVATTNVGSSFYIWDANQGSKGGYTSYSFGSSSFNLPVGGAFSTTLSASGSIVFEEADKTSGTAGTMFKSTGQPNAVQLRLEDSTIFWDRLLLKFDDNAMATIDYPDAPKLYNPDMSFYTWSKDDSMLSIDARPYAEETIKLGLYSTQQKNFRIIASDFNMPSGTKLFLKDKYLNITEEITGVGYEYWFTVDANPGTWGDTRFELYTQGKPTAILANSTTESKLKVKLVPNPASEKLTVYLDGAKGNTTVTVTNLMGVKVAEEEMTGNMVTMPLSGIANGMYMVTVTNGSRTCTQKLIKQ